MSEPDRVAFDRGRIDKALRILELMAAGDTHERLPISDRHDELDALAYAVNVLVAELGWTGARMQEAQEARVAAAERAEASKTTFIRNMSHEIRTPIAAMIGLAELLLSDDPSPPQDLVQRLQANGKAVLSLLDDLLDLAKLDADRVVLDPEPVPVVELVREVAASLEMEQRANRTDIRVDAAHDSAGFIVTDRFRLRQILANLMTNAVKFTRDGSVTIVVKTKCAEDGEHCTIDVVDTGIGIAAPRQEHIFEPFEQGDEKISQLYGGSGLGLTLSRRLARRLGGDLGLAQSTPGKGSTFRLFLKSLPAPQRGEPKRAAAASAAGAAGLRILLAEDHRDLHKTLRLMLERAGAIVVSAYDGHAAVAQASEAPFDVILLDLRMPRMDGLEAARAIRSQGCATRIVALTADPTTTWRAAALGAGCDDCVSKPFTLDQLMLRSPHEV